MALTKFGFIVTGDACGRCIYPAREAARARRGHNSVLLIGLVAVLQQTYSTRFSDFALEFYTFVADNYAGHSAFKRPFPRKLT